MKDETDLQLVEGSMKLGSVNPERIPTAQHARRCDFVAWDPGEKYLVEVKGIHDEEEIQETLRRGQVFETDRSVE